MDHGSSCRKSISELAGNQRYDQWRCWLKFWEYWKTEAKHSFQDIIQENFSLSEKVEELIGEYLGVV